MRRAAIFAHYDKDNIVDDYVIYYLKALKEVACEIIFVSCNPIVESEKLKLDGIADFIIDEKHDEYDFGSYKRGYLYLKERLNDFDELIFANDSCYGPLYPLREVFDKMETEEQCDFWGITKNRFGVEKNDEKYVVVNSPHLQSYFLVFKRNVFLSKVFDEFMQSIKHFDNKNDIIINYEIGLSEKLTQEGFLSCSYIKVLYRFNHVLISFWRLLIEKYKMPFVKSSVLRLNSPFLTTIEKWEETIAKYTEYPIELITLNLTRTRERDMKKRRYVPFCVKKYFFYFMGIQPAIFKRTFYIALKKYLSFLCD